MKYEVSQWQWINFFNSLTEMQRESLPVYVGALPEGITDEQIVTVVRPLNIALAAPLAERLAAMVAAYGSVAALEQQNALVITETAGQIRRLLRIVDEPFVCVRTCIGAKTTQLLWGGRQPG